MYRCTYQQHANQLFKLDRVQEARRVLPFYHRHENIYQRQKLYKDYINSVQVAERVPESLHSKRKRVCKEFMQREALVAEPKACDPNRHLVGVEPKNKTCDIVLELLQDLQATMDVEYNFIIRDLAHLGEKRKRAQTKHYRF